MSNYMDNDRNDERFLRRKAIGAGLLVFILAGTLLGIAARVFLLEAMDDPVWSHMVGIGIWLTAIGLSVWQVRHDWPDKTNAARSPRRAMLLISIVMICLGVLSIVVCAAVVLPRTPGHHKALERERQRLLMLMIEWIEDDKHMRSECEKLLEAGHTPNEAIASTIARYSLSAVSSTSKAPMLKQNDTGRWVVVDLYGKPYDIQAVNGSYRISVRNE